MTLRVRWGWRCVHGVTGMLLLGARVSMNAQGPGCSSVGECSLPCTGPWCHLQPCGATERTISRAGDLWGVSLPHLWRREKSHSALGPVARVTWRAQTGAAALATQISGSFACLWDPGRGSATSGSLVGTGGMVLSLDVPIGT